MMYAEFACGRKQKLRQDVLYNLKTMTAESNAASCVRVQVKF